MDAGDASDRPLSSGAEPAAPPSPAPGPAVVEDGEPGLVRRPSRLGSARPVASASGSAAGAAGVGVSSRPGSIQGRDSGTGGALAGSAGRPWTRETDQRSTTEQHGVSLENNPSLLAEDNVMSAIDAPRYAMPNVASMLPTYLNSESEFIYRSFHTGNYNDIAHLPETLEHQEVIRKRQQNMEAARKMLAPHVDSNGKLIKLPSKAVTNRGLFSEFEYIPMSYSMEHDIEEMEKEQHRAAQQEIAGTEFLPVNNITRLKYEDIFEDGKTYPYMSDPYDASDQLALRAKWIHESRCLAGPLVPGGSAKQEEQWPNAPTKHMASQSMAELRDMILQDWDDSELSIYPNDREVWVIRFKLSTVDSEKGLVAYMNILVRCNPLVNKYNLTKVVEHWNVKPGDGYVYFTLRPPWIRLPKLQTYYTLHPEERSYPTKVMFEAEERAVRKAAADARRAEEREAAAVAAREKAEREEAAHLARIDLLDQGAGATTGRA